MRFVRYGKGEFVRVGVVVGEFKHTWLGDVLMVRTATNIAKEQQFDPVPSAQVEDVTVVEFHESAKRELSEIADRVHAFVEEVRDEESGS